MSNPAVLVMAEGTTPTHTLTIDANLTGWTATLTVRALPLDPAASAAVSVTSPSGLTVTSGATSTVVWHVTAAQSVSLPQGVYAWGLTLTSGSETERVEWPDGSFVGTLSVASVVRTTP